MENNRIPLKAKRFFSDTIWSISGLVFMNAVAQFAVYPYWNRVLGLAQYGNSIYLLAVMNILAISIGSGINYVRMRQSANRKTSNRPYLLLMMAGTLISLLVLFVLFFVNLLHSGLAEFWLFCLLTVMTMWRFYADVEYRLHINYKGYFLYYLVIGLGYLVGIGLFRIFGLWPLALLPGEIAGLTLVLWRGSIFKHENKQNQEDFSTLFKLTLLLVGSNILGNLIFNGDRFILRWFVGGSAVSIYYIASLFGKTVSLITTPLNGVLVGHLAKYNGKLTKQLMRQITGLSALVVLLATATCLAASFVVLPVLYPAEFETVKRYLLIANAAQVIYFAGNVLTASILLRFTPARNQLIVNVAHAFLFVLLCVPLALLWGINAFCWGLLGANSLRFILCLALGFFYDERNDDIG